MRTILERDVSPDSLSLYADDKPLLWVHVPYERNSRQWNTFLDRMTTDVNQPYLYLTMQSIVHHCHESFTICIVDDTTFATLLPTWTLSITTTPAPMQHKLRTLAMAKVLYAYGGMWCPVSFLCMRDMRPLYDSHAQALFVGQFVNRTITADTVAFVPDPMLCGAPRQCPTLQTWIAFLQQLVSTDPTDESVCTGTLQKWLVRNQIQTIPAVLLGTQHWATERPVCIEDLLNDAPPHTVLYNEAVGVYIPAHEILQRTRYSWFAHMSPEDILLSRMWISDLFRRALHLPMLSPSAPSSLQSALTWVTSEGTTQENPGSLEIHPPPPFSSPNPTLFPSAAPPLLNQPLTSSAIAFWKP